MTLTMVHEERGMPKDLASSGQAESAVFRIRMRLLLILLPISIFDADDFDCYATR